jgi:hypothetical protein
VFTARYELNLSGTIRVNSVFVVTGVYDLTSEYNLNKASEYVLFDCRFDAGISHLLGGY